MFSTDTFSSTRSSKHTHVFLHSSSWRKSAWILFERECLELFFFSFVFSTVRRSCAAIVKTCGSPSERHLHKVFHGLTFVRRILTKWLATRFYVWLNSLFLPKLEPVNDRMRMWSRWWVGAKHAGGGGNWIDIQQCAIERRRKIDTTLIYNIRICSRFAWSERNRAVANNIN